MLPHVEIVLSGRVERELWKEGNKTSMLTSHIQAQIRKLCCEAIQGGYYFMSCWSHKKMKVESSAWTLYSLGAIQDN